MLVMFPNFKKYQKVKLIQLFLSNFYRNIRTAKIIESDRLPKKANGVYYNNLNSMRRIGFFYDNTKEHFSIGALTGNGKILKSSFEENVDIFNNFKSEKRSI